MITIQKSNSKFAYTYKCVHNIIYTVYSMYYVERVKTKKNNKR